MLFMETMMQAQQLMEENKSEEALQLLQVHLEKADEEEQYTIAEFYMQWGFLEEAQHIFVSLLTHYPDESELKIMLSDIYIELEKDEAAIDLLNDIEQDDPLYLQALLQLADLYQALGLYEVAERKLLIAKEAAPKEPIIDFALGELLFSIGKYHNAITFYEKVIPVMQTVAQVSINNRLAEAYAAIGSYEKALTYFQHTEDESPDILFKYGYTAYQVDRKDIAIKAWERLIDLDPHYQSVYIELARAYEEEEFIQEAYEMCLKGIQKDEFNKEICLFAGKLAYQLNKMNDSKTFAYQAIQLDSEYKEATLFLLELLKEHGEWTEVISVINTVKNSEALDPIYEWELAQSYNHLERYTEALTAYEEAFPHLQDDADFLKEFGYFLVEDGKIERATSILQAYLKIVPLDGEVEAYLERLIH